MAPPPDLVQDEGETDTHNLADDSVDDGVDESHAPKTHLDVESGAICVDELLTIPLLKDEQPRRHHRAPQVGPAEQVEPGPFGHFFGMLDRYLYGLSFFFRSSVRHLILSSDPVQNLNGFRMFTLG